MSHTGHYKCRCSVVLGADEDHPVAVYMRYRAKPMTSDDGNQSGGATSAGQTTSVVLQEEEWGEIQSVESSTGVAEFTLTDLVEDTVYEIQVSLDETFADETVTEDAEFVPARVPAAPTDVILTPGDGEISVSWSPPADDGGSDITEYIVQWKSGDQEFDSTRQAQADVQNLMHTIDELSNGVEYDVQVIAANVIGEGDPSAVESATPTQAVVTTVAQVRILNVSRSGATAEVTLLNRDENAATTVYLRYRAATGQQAWSTTPSANALADTVEFTLSGLEPSTEYEAQASLDDMFPVGARISVTFTTQSAPQPSRITSSSAFTVDEGETRVATLAASDADTPASQLVWSILPASADGDEFLLSGGGSLFFLSAKDYENPDDANCDGVYELTVRVSDGENSDTATIHVTLRDVSEDVTPTPTSVPTPSPMPTPTPIPTPTPTIEVNYQAVRYSVVEGSNVSVSVVLSSSHSEQVSIPIQVISSGTAETGDYSILGLSNNALSIPRGQLSRSFTVATNEDSDADDEVIRLGFGALPRGISSGGVRMATITIIDDDVVSGTGGSSSRGISARNSPPRFIESHNAIGSIAENPHWVLK